MLGATGTGTRAISSSLYTSPSSSNAIPSSATGTDCDIGLGGAIVGKTVFAAITGGFPLVNLSAGAVIKRPSRFVIVLYTWKLSALYIWKLYVGCCA